MNKMKWLIAGISLAVIWLVLSIGGYLIYTKLVNQVEVLEEDLKIKNQVLAEVNSKFSQAKQENTIFVEEKENLANKIILQNKHNVAIQETGELLKKQGETLIAEKEVLERELADMHKSNQSKIKLYKSKLEVNQKDFVKQIKLKNTEFLSEKTALEEQISVISDKLKELLKQNQESSIKLDLSKQKIIELKLANGQETDLSVLTDREVRQFKKGKLKLHYNAGVTFDQISQYKKALAEYEQALSADPNDPDTHFNMAVIYDEHLVDKKKAIEHYYAYLKFCPNTQDAARVDYWIREAKKELEWNR